MRTPIVDFIERYTQKNALRLHMPGHKGTGGYAADITEIPGADSLYAPCGIIAESEQNASVLFGGTTFYSAEGSSHTIRAMVHLAGLYCRENNLPFRILAGRNAHKSFLSAAGMTDAEVIWLYPEKTESYLSCTVTPARLLAEIQETKPACVYITSPDYLGNESDIAALSSVCRKEKVLLLVDNAHGAYLRFLPQSRHPLDLGADLCCDSAHKTLPVLTGGAYLHVSKNAPSLFSAFAKDALALFGSTSPSYLILASLDKANRYLAEEYPNALAVFLQDVETTRQQLTRHGYTFLGREPLKFTLSAKKYGYTGTALAAILDKNKIFCEFADPDFVVFMLSPETGKDGLRKLTEALLSIPKKAEIDEKPPAFSRPQPVCSIREALFSPKETVSAENAAGRILADVTVGCPPAVPILVSGERIDENALRAFRYYGIEKCAVLQ